jgi:hypothetical protein
VGNRRRHVQSLFDEGKVLVEVAIKLRCEAIVFEGQFKLRGEGVVWGGGQMPVQVLENPLLSRSLTASGGNV